MNNSDQIWSTHGVFWYLVFNSAQFPPIKALLNEHSVQTLTTMKTSIYMVLCILFAGIFFWIVKIYSKTAFTLFPFIYLLNVVFFPNLSVVVNINLEDEILIFLQWFPPGNFVCSEDGDSLQRLIDQLKELDGVNKRQMTDSTGSVPSLDTSDLQSQEASKRQQENADIRPQKR